MLMNSAVNYLLVSIHDLYGVTGKYTVLTKEFDGPQTPKNS